MHLQGNSNMLCYKKIQELKLELISLVDKGKIKARMNFNIS